MNINPSIIKWPGGKKQELKVIKQLLPSEFENYYEPFVGGGICFLNIEAKNYFINDKCDDLINIYESVNSKLFLEKLHQFDIIWEEIKVICNKDEILKQFHEGSILEYLLLTIESNQALCKATEYEKEIFLRELKKRITYKLKNIAKFNTNSEVSEKDIKDNLEASVKSAYYNYNRYLLNTCKSDLSIPLYSAVYFFIRDMSYSGMFRYSLSGDFNVPYGGIGYNKKKFETKIQYYKSQFLRDKLSKTQINCEDFSDFFNITKPSSKDFIFLDPPYDTEFSTYSNNIFDQSDQKRLAKYLLEETSAKWMTVIKKTDFIDELYSGKKLNIFEFDKKYQVSFQGRNNRDCVHQVITNYDK